MKVILYMAMSVNGYIARENGDEDFLSHENWNTFCELADNLGGFIIGRKTYEAVKKWNEGYSFDDVNVLRVVVSSNFGYEVDKDYLLASSPDDALNKCTEKGLKQVLVTGGGSINSAFMKSNLVDEIILNVEPFVLGKGLNIFSKEEFENKLELIKIKELPSNIIQLHYKVEKLGMSNK